MSLPILKKINAALGQKSFMFSIKFREVKHPSYENGITFVATDKSEISYITEEINHKRLFIARQNYQGFPFTNTTNKFMNKKRTTYIASGQDFWNAFSQYVVQEAGKRLRSDPNFRNLKTLFLFLGEKRQICAQRLNHERNSLRTGEFGMPRYGVNQDVREFVSEYGTWGHLYPKIKERLYQYKQFFKQHGGNDFDSYYTYPSDDSKPDTFKISLSNSNSNSNSILSQIVFKYYTIQTEKEFDKLFDTLQPRFDKLLAWDEAGDPEELLYGMGELAFNLYRMLPTCLGTSSMVNWLMHSIADYHNLALEPIEKEDDLTPDWEAFLTLSSKQYKYMDWFVEHVYRITNKPAIVSEVKEEKQHPIVDPREQENKIERNSADERTENQTSVNAHAYFVKTARSDKTTAEASSSELTADQFALELL